MNARASASAARAPLLLQWITTTSPSARQSLTEMSGTLAASVLAAATLMQRKRIVRRGVGSASPSSIERPSCSTMTRSHSASTSCIR
jgi:hypothetical protein